MHELCAQINIQGTVLLSFRFVFFFFPGEIQRSPAWGQCFYYIGTRLWCRQSMQVPTWGNIVCGSNFKSSFILLTLFWADQCPRDFWFLVAVSAGLGRCRDSRFLVKVAVSSGPVNERELNTYRAELSRSIKFNIKMGVLQHEHITSSKPPKPENLKS